MKARAVTLVAALVMAGCMLSRYAVAASGTHAEPFGASPQWQASQAVQADRQGRVYLLRSDTIEVYPVLKNGQLDKPIKLEAAGPLDGPMLDAAMGDGPGDWLIRMPTGLRWFVNGKEKTLPPLPWQPQSVGYLRGAPVVGVTPRPAPVNGILIIKKNEELPATAPAVLSLSGDRWSTLVEEAWPDKRDSASLLEGCARSILGDRTGKLWTARNYAYVLDRYSPAGRRLMQIVVEKGRVAHREEKDVGIPSEIPAADRAHFHPFLGVLKVADLTEGPDRRIYLAAQGGKGLELDRFDPVDSSLERVELGLQVPGFLSMAAGRDALYVAAPTGDHGRWRISWDELDQANWKRVPIEDGGSLGRAPETGSKAPTSTQPPAVKAKAASKPPTGSGD